MSMLSTFSHRYLSMCKITFHGLRTFPGDRRHLTWTKRQIVLPAEPNNHATKRHICYRMLTWYGSSVHKKIMKNIRDGIFSTVQRTESSENGYSAVTANHVSMMTSSNGNTFRVTGPLCGEITDQRWILRTKASDAELWCFLWFAPE